jgi:hypothetical protein
MPSSFISNTRRGIASGGGGGPINLAMAMQTQNQTEWCWAAVSVSTALFYSPASGFTQCQIVNQQLNQADCCANGSSAACNQPGFLDQALTYVGHFNPPRQGNTLPMATLMGEFAAGRVVGVRIQWTGGGGHFVALDGGDFLGQTISVKDPIYGPSTYDYNAFNGQYQTNGSWTDSYLTQ